MIQYFRARDLKPGFPDWRNKSWIEINNHTTYNVTRSGSYASEVSTQLEFDPDGGERKYLRILPGERQDFAIFAKSSARIWVAIFTVRFERI